MDIVLIGYRGSGKTTIGQLLARRLGMIFVDVDDLIVARAGKSIREIFAEDGEAAFRDLETAVLRQVAALDGHVIGLGGGTLMRPRNRAMLQRGRHRAIYLRCQAEELLRRTEADPRSSANRPALTDLGGGIEEVRRLLVQREPVYRQMAEAEVDVTHLAPEKAADEIVRLLGLTGLNSHPSATRPRRGTP